MFLWGHFCSILISLKLEPRKTNDKTMLQRQSSLNVLFCAFQNHAYASPAPSFMFYFKIVWHSNLLKQAYKVSSVFLSILKDYSHLYLKCFNTQRSPGLIHVNA